ncbi:MAG: HAMP domain-containing protein [Hyphomonadaceae bacterium]|nr:HAMP domain-containing protein [Hyphomonadaceae bacterium]MCA8885603.1 HAMP domain-containing protein [Hyphomonadaceae bacterium]
MREARGLPIAAYLGMLVAIALAAAFVATLAIVIFLPPRPPDVMRADVVADNFQAGYDHMIALNRPMNERGMVWDVRTEPPDEDDDSPAMSATRSQLAQAIELRPDQIHIQASNVVQNDTFVFRVAERADWTEQSQQAVADAQAAADEARREHDEAVERLEAARERIRDLEQERDEMSAHEHAIEIARERARERDEARAEAAAERQAAAAERMAQRMEQRIQIDGGRVIIHRSDGAGRETVEIHGPNGEVQHIEAPNYDVNVRVPRVEMTPPVPPVTPVAPTPAEPVTAPAVPQATTSARTPRAAPAAPASPLPPMFAPAPEGVVLISGFEIGAQLPDGRWLFMRQGRNWAELGWIARAAGIIGGTLLLLSILAVLFARYLTRPIRSFSDAVQAVGVNPQSEPVVEEGPQELRGAARAVNTMQARLRALIADRTKTLAAVAHDMRTPLMRLRLAAENAPPEQREKMAKEIGEVEALVASFIAFARDDPAEEARVRLDLAALLQSLADDHADQNRSVTYDGDERFIVTGQSLGLKRLFGNLIENALKYGSAARIKLRSEEGAVVVDVEDDGPGIPEDQRESVFEAFVRLNEEGTRGAGLGLAAARSIARAHGGDIAISDAESGALIRVTLPL